MNRTPLYLAAIATFLTLYIPQPLQPHLAALYHKSTALGGALTTMALLPMALAPVLYGYVLGNVRPERLLLAALTGLGLSNVLFAAIPHFEALLLIRFLQGALIPVAIAAIIALLLVDAGSNHQKILSGYVACTIIGGFLGRLLAGVFAAFWHWQALSLGVGLGMWILAWRFAHHPNPAHDVRYQRPHWRDLLTLLKNRNIALWYLMIFLMFSCFVGLLNYLPFIVHKAMPKHASLTTGLLYSGYITGAVVAVMADRIVRRFGLKPSLLSAALAFVLSMLMLYFESMVLTFMALFVFCAAQFLMHSVAIAQVNQSAGAQKPLANAFYTAFYYLGGVYGSWVPGLIYQGFGLGIFLAFLVSSALLGILALLCINKH